MRQRRNERCFWIVCCTIMEFGGTWPIGAKLLTTWCGSSSKMPTEDASEKRNLISREIDKGAGRVTNILNAHLGSPLEIAWKNGFKRWRVCCRPKRKSSRPTVKQTKIWFSTSFLALWPISSTWICLMNRRMSVWFGQANSFWSKSQRRTFFWLNWRVTRKIRQKCSPSTKYWSNLCKSEVIGFVNWGSQTWPSSLGAWSSSLTPIQP